MMAKPLELGVFLTTASATGYGVAIPTAYRSQRIILPPSYLHYNSNNYSSFKQSCVWKCIETVHCLTDSNTWTRWLAILTCWDNHMPTCKRCQQSHSQSDPNKIIHNQIVTIVLPSWITCTVIPVVWFSEEPREFTYIVTWLPSWKPQLWLNFQFGDLLKLNQTSWKSKCIL